METIDLDYCFINPNLFDFKANTLRKAIVKLHRLNAACHSSPDDWALNMLECTKDLTDPDAQAKFYHYLSNPSGFTENKELWDALEKFDQEHTDPTIIRDVQHDPWDDSNFVQESKKIGHTQYIYVKNTEWKPGLTMEPELGSIEEADEKICDAD